MSDTLLGRTKSDLKNMSVEETFKFCDELADNQVDPEILVEFLFTPDDEPIVATQVSLEQGEEDADNVMKIQTMLQYGIAPEKYLNLSFGKIEYYMKTIKCGVGIYVNCGGNASDFYKAEVGG